MKKKLLIGLVFLILVIGIIAFIILLNSDKEDLYIDISEYYDKNPGIYEKIENNDFYVVVIYSAECDGEISELNIVANENDKQVEKIKTHSNTRNLKKGSKGYFIGKAKNMQEINRYTYYIELDEKYSALCSKNKTNFKISANGLVTIPYVNNTDKEVFVESCEIVLKDKDGKVIDRIITVLSDNKIMPYGELTCFGETKIDINKIDLEKSELKIKFK